MAPYNVLDNHYVNYAQFKPYEAKDYNAVRLVSAEAQMDFTTFNANKEFFIDGIKTTEGIISLNPGYQFQAIPDSILYKVNQTFIVVDFGFGNEQIIGKVSLYAGDLGAGGGLAGDFDVYAFDRSFSGSLGDDIGQGNGAELEALISNDQSLTKGSALRKISDEGEINVNAKTVDGILANNNNWYSNTGLNGKDDNTGSPGEISFYTGLDAGVPPKKYRFIVIRVGQTNDDSDVRFGGFGIYTVDRIFKNYNVEFDDALLDLQGWKNPRWAGSKLKALRINEYSSMQKNPTFPNIPLAQQFPGGADGIPNTGEFAIDFHGQNRWGGDISFGLNPVIHNEISAIYIGSSLTSGIDDKTFVEIDGHSYVQIDKFLLINIKTDEVQIIDRINVNPQAFKRFVQTDFPEGSRIRFKLLDNSINTNIKANHFVKFNEGNLMRVYSYTPNTDGFEDGVFGGIGVRGKGRDFDGGDEANQYMKGALVGNLGSGSNSSMQYPSASDCGGLFGFGMTAAISASLFNTESIDFVETLPDELSAYQEEINTEIMGENLILTTGSYGIVQPTSTTSSVNDGGVTYTTTTAVPYADPG